MVTRHKPGAKDRNSIRGPSRDHRSDQTPSTTRTESRSALRQFVRDHRRALLLLLGAGVAIIFVFAVLPQLAGFGKSLHRLRYGNKVWLGIGVGLEAASLLGYMALFRMIFSCEGVRVAWRSSYQITMAGAVATKLLAAGGAGGIALTVWALRAAGLSARSVARRMTSFEMLLYAVFMVALVIFGGGLAVGVLPGRSPSALTVLPAILGAVVIALVVGLGFASEPAHRWLSRLAQRGGGRGTKLLSKLANVPGTLHGGFQTSAEILRQPRLGLLGAVAYWAFDIATLWAGFRAFGASPPIPVVVLAYFVGQLANALPIPGGDRWRGGRHDRLVHRLWRQRQHGRACRPGLPDHLLLAPGAPGLDCLHAPARPGRQVARRGRRGEHGLSARLRRPLVV